MMVGETERIITEISAIAKQYLLAYRMEANCPGRPRKASQRKEQVGGEEALTK
jgi:hypothetical protein